LRTREGHIDVETAADGSLALSWSRRRAMLMAGAALGFVVLPGIGIALTGASRFLWSAFAVSSAFLLSVALLVLRAATRGPLYTLDVPRRTVFRRGEPLMDFDAVDRFEIGPAAASSRFRLTLAAGGGDALTLFEDADVNRLRSIGAACARTVGVALVVDGKE
jgi:hypothetical protein